MTTNIDEINVGALNSFDKVTEFEDALSKSLVSDSNSSQINTDFANYVITPPIDMHPGHIQSVFSRCDY